MYVSFSCRKLLIAKQGLFPIARGDELLVPTARSDGLRLSPVIKNLFPLPKSDSPFFPSSLFYAEVNVTPSLCQCHF